MAMIDVQRRTVAVTDARYGTRVQIGEGSVRGTIPRAFTRHSLAERTADRPYCGSGSSAAALSAA